MYLSAILETRSPASSGDLSHPTDQEIDPMKYALTVAVFACVFSSGLVATAADDTATAPEVVEVFGAGKLTIPENWQRSRPGSSMIEHEFQIKDGEGDDAATARVTMMAAGGDVKANVDRWKGQMPGGDPAAQKTEEKKFGNWTAHIIDLSGNFKDTMGGGPFSGGRVVERKNYAMLGLILVNEANQKYFIKITGPQDLIKANRAATLQMLDSLQD